MSLNVKLHITIKQYDKQKKQWSTNLQAAFESCQLSHRVVLFPGQYATQSHTVHLLTCLCGLFNLGQLLNLSLSLIIRCIGKAHASDSVEGPSFGFCLTFPYD